MALDLTGARMRPRIVSRRAGLPPRTAIALGAALLAVVLVGCDSSSSSSSSSTPSTTKEVNPAGDIPDNQAFVAYRPPGQGYSVKVPEGWSRSNVGGAVVFTDKLNAIRLETVPAQAPLTVREARATEVPKLVKTVKGFRPGTVSTVTRSAGPATRITYLATGSPNLVTGKVTQDAVERYVFFHKGRDVVLTLSGPKTADNVDPWKLVSNSVRWSP
jgi:hypothetical protein